jgi:hypothetical protein
MGFQMDTHFSTFHHVLNRARWSALEVSRRLLQLLVSTFVKAGGTVDIVIDETLERRWGRKIRKRGHYRDSLLSSKEQSVSNSGLRWITRALVVSLPWTKVRWALPFLSVLATTPKVSADLHKRHKTIARIAQQLVAVVRRWLPNVSIKVIGDSAYSVIELGLTCGKQRVSLIAPLRLDARLFAPPPLPKPHQKGRRCVVGKRLSNLSKIGSVPKTQWQPITVTWYGGSERTLEVTTGTALWYSTGTDPLPIRWVLTRDPKGKREPRAYFSTNPAQCAAEIVEDYIKHWPIEVTYEESRAYLGWRRNANGLTWRLNGARPASSGCIVWLCSWDTRSIPMATFLSSTPLGMPRRRQRSVMCWPRCVSTTGAAWLFRHRLLIQKSF